MDIKKIGIGIAVVAVVGSVVGVSGGLITTVINSINERVIDITKKAKRIEGENEKLKMENKEQNEKIKRLEWKLKQPKEVRMLVGFENEEQKKALLEYMTPILEEMGNQRDEKNDELSQRTEERLKNLENLIYSAII